jgi:hypothetical protein
MWYPSNVGEVGSKDCALVVFSDVLLSESSMPHHAKPAGYLVEVDPVAPPVDLGDLHLPLFGVPDAPLKAL